MVVTAGNDQRVRSFPGLVEASRTVELAFLVSGLLTELPVREGQTVEKGGLIAQLRQDEFQTQLRILQSKLDQAKADLTALRAGERTEQRQRLEAQLRAANATLANAETEYNRHVGLLRNNAISRATYERIETAYRVALEDQRAAQQLLEKATMARLEEIDAKEAQIRGLEARVDEGTIQLKDSTLLAPFKGVVARRFVEERQSIRAQNPVVLFQDTEEILIGVDVPEQTMAASIRPDDIEKIVAEFSGLPGRQFPAAISEIAKAADPITQTFKVRVSMKVPQDVNLLPGMTSRVSLVYRSGSTAGNNFMVPVSAVFKDSSGDQLAWVIGQDGSVKRQIIKLGIPVGNEIEVLEGLKAGDRIATAGVSFLRSGMKVRDLGNSLGGGRP
jgi:RND family efflux transporter MFP subunit